MKSSPSPSPSPSPERALDDALLAATLACEAGALLRRLRSENANAMLTNKALGDAGDAQANTFLIDALKRERPLDAILSEESADDFLRLNAERVWIIDPLDGTREYREGRDDWAVHVALVSAGQVIAAAVAIPSRDEVCSSNDGKAAMESRARIHANACPPDARQRALPALLSPAATSTNIVVISRSRPPSFAQRVATALGADLKPIGSAGAKAMMVVRGDALAYVHDGGMNEWDAAAPVGVALAHGLHVCDLRGNAITFNHRDVVLREGLIICRAELTTTILAAL